jgi:hypothetical protein
VQKVYAEDKLKNSLGGFKRTLEKPEIRTGRRGYNTGILLASTSSTDNTSDDLESPVCVTKVRKLKREQRGVPPIKAERMKRKPHEQDASSLNSFWIAPTSKSDCDASSVSNLTSGGASTDDEDDALDVLSEDPRSRLHVTRRPRAHHGIRHSSVSADEFGSIAPSNP